MSSDATTPLGRWARVAAAGLVGGLAAGLIGYFPTLRLAGVEAIPALLAGCSVAVAAGWIGAVPVAWGGSGAQLVNRMLAGTAVRMGAAVLLGAAVALSGWFPLKPLLVWVAIAYLGALAGETVALMSLTREQPKQSK